MFCCFRPAWQCSSSSIERILKRLYARIREILFFRAVTSKFHAKKLEIKNLQFRSECKTPEWDLDCLVYMLYTLEFCVFIQAIWPLDATFFIYLISCFNRSSKAGFNVQLNSFVWFVKNHDKAKENRDEEMRLEQIPKFFREKNENLKDSIILRKTRASDESRKESDVSSSLNIKL